jgi:23S rRNA (pseudouridine1915-N3)-methyltransferase
VLLKLVAAGTRLPGWVNAGCDEYASRLRGDYRLELVEIALGRRTGAESRKAVIDEGQRMLTAIGRDATVVALQVEGKPLTTPQLARWLDDRAHDTSEIAFCIGGPDGLAPALDTKARLRWSLSPLTLPHGLARVVVAEALYRAVTVIKGHPYHRA